MLGTKSEPDWWSEQLRRTAKRLVEQKRRPVIFALAWQCWQLEDQALAKTLFAAAMDKIDDAKEKTAMTLAGVEFLWHTSQVAHADDLLKQLAADKELQKQAGLWRMAVKFADHRDMAARSLDSLEKALELEYQKLPAVIDLETVRREYGRLLGHYAKLAESMVTLNVRPTPDFLAKVVRVADRWRALDRDSSEPCTQAAWILQRLGDRELGWDYLTTPIGLKPNEAEPWLTLASNLTRKGDLALADLAYKSAFETEPTNAQILWDRAENLRRLGKNVEAATLFRQIAEGTWQPRFQGLVNQARTQVRD
jgi:tetratricopeptide (TPR) repeat protein